MAYTNSKMVSYKRLSPNHSGKRTHSIDRITPHCVVGQCSVETLGNIFAPRSRQASCNYGIGPDGRVGMYVEEKNRSWCSSSNANDQRAVTIECASNPGYFVFDENGRIVGSTTSSTKTVDELAKEVIKGLWGNGADRKAKLTAAGYDYAKVQKRVNELLK